MVQCVNRDLEHLNVTSAYRSIDHKPVHDAEFQMTGKVSREKETSFDLHIFVIEKHFPSRLACGVEPVVDAARP